MRAVLLPLLGLLAAAQAAEPPPAPAAPQALAPVQVTGKRLKLVDPAMVEAAKSKILSRNYASSCAFMGAYNAADDDVVLAYLSGFAPDEATERFSDRAPEGDASRDTSASTASNAAVPADPATSAQTPGCGRSDRAFAAGRNAILRKDKTLLEAFEAAQAEDYAKARTLFQASWDKIGYEEAALMLGKLWLFGLGGERDLQQAQRWLREVVDARYDPQRDRLKFDPQRPEALNPRVEAAMLLAKMHLSGPGRNSGQVRTWYAKALDFGFMPAAYLLGMADLAGYGGEGDARRALRRLDEAAGAGHVPALYQLGKLHYLGAEGVPQDLPRAGAYFVAAAKSGHAGAHYMVGRMYDLGEGVAADPARALVHYKDAAIKGQPDAQNALAVSLYSGQGVAQNLETARKLFTLAATRGQPEAMFNLAAMCIRGEGGAKDLAQAYAWLSLAKASGHESADAALQALRPRLSPEERARAEAMLGPAAKPKT